MENRQAFLNPIYSEQYNFITINPIRQKYNESVEFPHSRFSFLIQLNIFNTTPSSFTLL